MLQLLTYFGAVCGGAVGMRTSPLPPNMMYTPIATRAAAAMMSRFFRSISGHSPVLALIGHTRTLMATKCVGSVQVRQPPAGPQRIIVSWQNPGP